MENVLVFVSLMLLWIVGGIIISLLYVCISITNMTKGMTIVERDLVYDLWSEELKRRKMNTWITNKLPKSLFIIKWGLTWPELIMVNNDAFKAVQKRITGT